MREPLKILFKFPCRGRVSMFFDSLNSIHNNVRDKENYHVGLTLDEDDFELNNDEVKNKLSHYPNTSIQWGVSGSKIRAVNRSLPDYDFDVIICWSQDMFAEMVGFDDIMRQYMYSIINEHGDDFLIHFPERDAKEMLNVLYIATKKYYSRFNYIYHPSYLSLWCDNESMCVAKMLNKYHYVGVGGLYVHKNPAYSQYGIERDSLFNEQQGMWATDEKNFHERRRRNFDLKDEEIVNQLVSETFPYTS